MGRLLLNEALATVDFPSETETRDAINERDRRIRTAELPSLQTEFRGDPLNHAPGQCTKEDLDRICD